MSEALILAVSGVLSGGFLGTVLSIYKARQNGPAERDSIIVSGAESSVLSLERALNAETHRADRAELSLAKSDEALARKDARIVALETRLDALQTALDAARHELHTILSIPDR